MRLRLPQIPTTPIPARITVRRQAAVTVGVAGAKKLVVGSCADFNSVEAGVKVRDAFSPNVTF
jgi:hypothetical protein